MFRNGSRKRLPEVLTEEELGALIGQTSRRAPTGARNRAMLLVMGRCGLRVGEVVALQTKDVERDALHVWRGKGAKDRTVPLDPQTGDALDRWIDVRRDLGIRARVLFTTITERAGGAADLGDGRVLDPATRPGKALSDRYIRQVVARLAKGAGIEKQVHPHTLRHTAATAWLRAGFNLREVQTLLGHSSTVTTEVYTHVFDEDLQRKQAALPPLDLRRAGR